MSVRWVWALWAILLLGPAGLAPAAAEQPVLVTVNAGKFNMFNGGGERREAGWEVSFAPRRYRWFPRFVPNLSPAVGAMANDQGTLYVYGGFRFDLPLGARWRLTPQLAGGVYYANGGRDLGGAVEFRSGIELTRKIGARSRIGVLVYHLSNSRLYSLNPGSESVVLTFSTRP